MLEMDESTFIDFYKNTVDEYSNYVKRLICNLLEEENKITYEEQIKLGDDKNCKYFPEKNYAKVVSETVSDKAFLAFYDKFDFIKMYKYSIPFFYEGELNENMKNLIDEGVVVRCHEIKSENYVISKNFDDVIPIYYELENGNAYIKFVFQKYYIKEDIAEQVDYRYVVIVYFDQVNHMIDIRYDSLKRVQETKTIYSQNIESVIAWLKTNLKFEIYKCNSANFLDVVNTKDTDVAIFKQLMDMGTAGQAELTASKDSDYILPFIGEIKEIITENEELFEKSPEIKRLLEDYLMEKELTASYPYVYLMWKKAVVSKQFIVKVTFSYFENSYIQLRHITGNCTDVRMERMNDAIQYFGSSRALIRGEEI